MKEYKYDLEFMIPVSMKGIFANRLRYFVQKGLKNFENYKILINFLVGREITEESTSKAWQDFDQWKNNYTENVEVRKISAEVDQCAAKVYDFYNNYCDFGQSKWIVRIDDDSLTNVSLLMSFLNDYDPEEYQYFTAQTGDGDLALTLNLLKKYNKYKRLKGEVDHEVEIAVISNAAFEKIIKENKGEIAERSTIQAGYTDQLFCYLAKISGIFPNTLRLLAADPRIIHFIDGHCAHIHHMSYDKNPGLMEIYDRSLENENVEFCDRSFAYLFKENPESTFNNEDMKVIFLQKGGTLNSKQRLELSEEFWTYNKEKKRLSIYDNYGKKIYEFEDFDMDKKNTAKYRNSEIVLRMIDM
jgi:hypothetical protein